MKVIAITDEQCAQLRAAQRARLPLFTNRTGSPVHSKPDGSDWEPLQWWLAATSEFGELGNAIKKTWRGDAPHEQLKRAIEDEWADVIIYLDVLAMNLGWLLPTCESHVLRYDDSLAYEWHLVHHQLDLLGREIVGATLCDEHSTCNDYNALRDTTKAMCRLAGALAIDPWTAISRKFNEVSERIGHPEIRL